MTSHLPESLQLILPIIAADQGRSRAQTLLAILCVDPDYVDQYLGSIDAALGANSPGLVGLAQLVADTRKACSASAPKVHRQHVMSQAILRRFCEQVRNNAGSELLRWDLRYGSSRLTGPGGVGYIQDFVKIDSAATEGVWRRVENGLPDAIAWAEAITAVAKNGTNFPESQYVSVMRDAIALHYVRNPRTLEIHEQSFQAAHDKNSHLWSSSAWSNEAFRRTYGLEPAGPEGRRLGAEALVRQIKTRFDEGAVFRLCVEELFDKVCDRFRSYGLELNVPAEPDSEFLIGDLPALTVTTGMESADVQVGVPLGEARTIVLPFTPRLLISLGPMNAVNVLSRSDVDRINGMQVHAAREFVCQRPGANFSHVLAARPNIPAPKGS